MKINLRWTSFLLAVCLLVSACTAPAKTGETQDAPVYELPAGLAGLQVVAEDADATGIGTGTAFVVTAPESPAPELLEQHLALSPPVPFTLLAGTEPNTFRLLPQETLSPGLIYRVEALTDTGERARSWAFQTRTPMAVTSTTPYDGSDYVSATTGIEVVFNRENVDISRHFSIDPPVEGRFLTYGSRSAFAPVEPLENGTLYSVRIAAGLTAEDGSILEEEYSFSFRVQSEDPTQSAPVEVYIEDYRAETFLSADPPVMSVSAHNMKGAQNILVEVFPVSSGDYIKELGKRAAERYESGGELYATAALSPALSFSRTLTPGTYQREIFDDAAKIWTYRMVQDTYAYGYLPFPETLPEGCYLVQVSAADPVTGEVDVRQKPLQINDTAVFAGVHNGQGVVWLNDAATGETLGGTEIRILDAQGAGPYSSATTGGDGSAVWQLGAPQSPVLLQVVRPGGTDYLDLLSASPEQPASAGQLYVSFAHTDRAAYMTGDTIRMWGVVRGRQEPLTGAEGLRLELDQGYYYGYYEEEHREPLYTYPVSLETDGAFTAELTFEDLTPGYYTVSLMDAEDRTLQSLSLLIADYEKPKYVSSVWSDKDLYLPGEMIDMNLSVSYYDGTPVYGMPYQVQLPADYSTGERPAVYYTPQTESGTDAYTDDPVDSSSWEEKMTRSYTNDQGVIRAEAAPPPNGSWRPYYYDYYFFAGEDNYYDYQYGKALYFPSTLLMQTELEHPSAGRAVVRVRTNALEASVPADYNIYDDAFIESITGAPEDTVLSVQVVKNTLYSEKEMELVAQTYDWASKRTLYQYDYNYACWNEKEVLASYDLRTQNGMLVLSDLPPEEEDENITYYVVLTARDSRGYQLEETIHLYPNFRPLFTEEADGSAVYRTGEAEYYLTYEPDFLESDFISDSVGMRQGDSADMILVKQQETYSIGRYYHYKAEREAVTEGRMLCYLLRDSVAQAGATEDMRFSYTMREEDIPSVVVLGAYFDGRHIYPVQNAMNLYYDYEEQRLSVELTADKERYGPGGEVNLTARVTGPDGAGVPARLSLSVVDEAMFALRDQRADPLPSLYANYRYAYGWNGYVSYRQHAGYYNSRGLSEEEPTSAMDSANPEVGGMGGGSGGGYIRQQFEDTAAFLVLETGDDGQAQAQFTLPDNLTSWRVTGAAVAGDRLMAGAGKINITASMDMFVNLGCNDTFLAGDDAGVSLTAQGFLLQGSTPVRYHAVLANAATGETVLELSRKGRSDVPLHLGFGKLPLGNYTLTVRGAVNDASDTLRKEFAVVSSNLELPVTRTFTLDDSGAPLDISPARYPVLIGFSDQRYGIYMDTAAYLAGRSGGDRLDTKVAGIAARRFLEQYLPEDCADYLEDIPKSYNSADLSAYQMVLLSLYAYESPDVELTARVLALTGGKTGEYMTGTLEDWAQFPDPPEVRPPGFEILEGSGDLDAWIDMIALSMVQTQANSKISVQSRAASSDEPPYDPMIDNPAFGIDPSPGVDDPAIGVYDPAPVVDDPATRVDDPAPVVDDPAPEVNDPAIGVDETPRELEERVLEEPALEEPALEEPAIDEPSDGWENPVEGVNPYSGSSYGIADSPDQKAAALMALAALNRPVLLELQKRLQEPELFTEAGRMYLVSGLAILGDYDTANAFYESNISPLLQAAGDYKHMPASGRDNGYRHTALALMTASLLNHEDAHALAGYLMNNRSTYYDPVIELAIYLGTFRPVDGGTTSFQYTKDGKTHKQELQPGEFHYVRLMKEDLENGIKAISGNVTATVSYRGGAEDFELVYPPEEGQASQSPVRVEREVRAATPEDLELFDRYDLTTQEELEELYTVTLRLTFDKTAPLGGYVLSDRVPSSLLGSFQTAVLYNGALCRYGYMDGFGNYSCDYDRQSRTYQIWRYHLSTFENQTPQEDTVEFIYIGKRSYPGESQFEPILISHDESGMNLLAEPSLSGSLAAEEGAGKRVWAGKNISGGTRKTEEEKSDA